MKTAPTKHEILNAVLKYYKTIPEGLFSRDRGGKNVIKKQTAIYLLFTDSVGTLEGCSKFVLEASGQSYNHSTIIHSRDKINAQKSIYKTIQKDIDAIRQLYPKKIDCIEFQNATRNLKVTYITNY